MKVAEIIIQKLNALQATNDILLERVYALEEKINDNFLLEEYVVPEPKSKPKGPSKPTQPAPVVEPRGPFQSKHGENPDQLELFTSGHGAGKKRVGRPKKRNFTQMLPPAIGRALLADDALADKTKASYAYFLEHIMNEPMTFQHVLDLRNQGMLTQDIAENVKGRTIGDTVFSKKSNISNCITVARRFGLTEIKDKKYVTTDAFQELKGA